MSRLIIYTQNLSCKIQTLIIYTLSWGGESHIAANCPAPRNRTTHGTDNKHHTNSGMSRLNTHTMALILNPAREANTSKRIRIGSILPTGVKQFHFGTVDAKVLTEDEIHALEVQENMMLMYDPDVQLDHTKSDHWVYGAPNGAIVGACSANCSSTRPARSENGKQ